METTDQAQALLQMDDAIQSCLARAERCAELNMPILRTGWIAAMLELKKAVTAQTAGFRKPPPLFDGAPEKDNTGDKQIAALADAVVRRAKRGTRMNGKRRASGEKPE